MVLINPFQSGQQFALLQDRQRVALDADRRRERGINALADQFGPGAEAPAEFTALQNQDLAAKRFAAGQEQRETQNTRQVEQDRIAAEDRLKKKQVGAARNVVNFFRAGIKGGASPEEITQRAAPALRALGVTDEQFAPLIAEITNDPAVLDQFEAALTQADATPRRAIGQPVPVRLPTGKTALLQTFNDGSSEVIDGATPLNAELAQQRAGVAERRVEVAEGTLGARLSENDRKVLGDTRKELTEINQERSFAEATVNAGQTVVRDIDTILDIADQAAGFGGDTFGTAVQRAVGAQVLATDAREIQRLIDSVKSNVGIDSLLRIKRSGAGLGQVPQSQLETLQSLLGNLDITRDPNLLLRDIRDIKSTYEGVLAKTNEGAARLDTRELQLLRRRNSIEQRNFNDAPNGEESLDDLLNRFAPEGG